MSNEFKAGDKLVMVRHGSYNAQFEKGAEVRFVDYGDVEIKVSGIGISGDLINQTIHIDDAELITKPAPNSTDGSFTGLSKEIAELVSKQAEHLLELIERECALKIRVIDLEHELSELKISARASAPKFQNTSCSNCGRGFGPGDSGFSHCESHAGMKATS